MTIHQIVVTAAKGGVAKSVTTVNLAYCLHLLGLRPLVVDLDPQGSASRYVGNAQRSETINRLATLTTRDAIQKELDQVTEFSLPEATSVLALAHGKIAIPQVFHGVSIIGYSHGAANLMATLKDSDAQDRFLDALDASVSASGCNLVLFDTPPSNQDAAQFAIGAATHMIIPLETTEEGLRGALTADRQRKSMINLARRKGYDRPFELVGVIPSNVHRCSLATKMLACARVAFGDLVTSQIDHAVAVGEACAEGLPVIPYEQQAKRNLPSYAFNNVKYTKSGRQFVQVASEIASRLGLLAAAAPSPIYDDSAKG